MRVALDYRPALHSRGGIGRSVRELSRALAGIGRPDLELHLFGHSWKAAPAATAPSGSQLHRLPLPGRSLPLLRGLGLDASRLAGRAELFHWTDYVHPPVRRGCAVVQTVHDLAFLVDPRFHGDEASEQLTRRFKQALTRADLLLCPSRATAEDLQRLCSPGAEIRVLPFGCDHVPPDLDPERGRRRAAELLQTGAPHLLALGTLEPRKNHRNLCEAWRSLGTPRPPLLIVGAAGWETEGLQRELSRPRPGLAWTGSLPDRDVFELLAGARALLYPSSLEGFGFPPMEALELGVPVLAGDCSALREHLGETASFVDGRDQEALVEALRRLGRDEGPGPKGPRLWRHRRDRYRWARCAEAHLEAYGSLMAQELEA